MMAGNDTLRGGQAASVGHALPSLGSRGSLFDINSSFDLTGDQRLLDYQVTGIQDGYVHLAFVLPQGMTRSFVSLFESLLGVVRVIDMKSQSLRAQRHAKNSQYDLVEMQNAENARSEFSERACSLYDEYLRLGHSENESIRLTNSALKAECHPWATYDQVKGVLRTAGKFRKIRLNRKERR